MSQYNPLVTKETDGADASSFLALYGAGVLLQQNISQEIIVQEKTLAVRLQNFLQMKLAVDFCLHKPQPLHIASPGAPQIFLVVPQAP